MKHLWLACLLLPAAGNAQYAPSASGSTTAAAEINSKPAIRFGSGAPSGNCTAGEDFYVDTVGQVLYFCPATNTWGKVQSALGYVPANVANNLSDLASASTARTNLGLGTAATQASSAFQAALANYSTISSLFGYPSTFPPVNTGNWAGTWQTFAPSYFQTALGYTPLNPANNLSDVASASAARTNLGLATVSYQVVRPAIIQAGSAVLGVSTPSSNPATATAHVGSNTIVASCDFAAGVTDLIQDHFPLPVDWSGTLNVEITWIAAATTGNVTWQLSTAGAAAGATIDPGFNAANTVTTVVNGSTALTNQSVINGLTVTGLSAGGEFFWQLGRSASDTMSGAAQLISITFTIPRT
jgi:hypothetical protein